LHVAQRFERFLDTYRRPDGRRWGGAELERATGGIVTRSYVTNLRKGRIESPGYAKMRAIAKVMGFSPEMWFEEDLDSEGRMSAGPEGTGIPGRLEHLFAVVKNPKTGEPYTNAEVARLSAGDLTEEEVGGIRAGKVTDPSVGRVAALAAAFGVSPSYLLDRGKHPQSSTKRCWKLWQTRGRAPYSGRALASQRGRRKSSSASCSSSEAR
jgi:transcriptional regulator with XRE-family HTH domain